MKVLAVTGITGHTGSYFLQELISNNFDGTVRCLVRESSNTDALDRSDLKIEKIVGSIEDDVSLHNLIRGADTVMHITNIRFSPLILRAAITEGVSRAVFVHTTGIYSQFKIASEDYKRIEKQMSELLKGSSIDVTILRPTMIFGDICDHNISKFIQMVDRLLIMPEINRGSCRIRPVNARDLGKAYYQAIYALNLPKLDYVVSGERSITMHELFLMIGSNLDKRVHFVSCPMWLGVFFSRVLKILTLGKIDMIEKVLRMGENRDYPHDEATNDFDYRPEVFEVGLKREIDQYILTSKTK